VLDLRRRSAVLSLRRTIGASRIRPGLGGAVQMGRLRRAVRLGRTVHMRLDTAVRVHVRLARRMRRTIRARHFVGPAFGMAAKVLRAIADVRSSATVLRACVFRAGALRAGSPRADAPRADAPRATGYMRGGTQMHRATRSARCNDALAGKRSGPHRGRDLRAAAVDGGSQIPVVLGQVHMLPLRCRELHVPIMFGSELSGRGTR
jgi:hypothetical protein